MWVKICANTNLDDALLAVEAGADAVGFVFAPSVRQVTAAEVARITPHLPDAVERIGVFSSGTAGEIAATVREAGLSGVQLHGRLDLDLVRELCGSFEGGLSVIQVAHWDVQADARSRAAVADDLEVIRAAGMPDRVLIDSKVGGATGGTGVAFDWAAARSVFASGGNVKLILAGGLTPANVGLAVAALHPSGVDVASGVEATPGRKSAEKVRLFIKEAKREMASIAEGHLR